MNAEILSNRTTTSVLNEGQTRLVDYFQTERQRDRETEKDRETETERETDRDTLEGHTTHRHRHTREANSSRDVVGETGLQF
jgi:hypothetical protein